MSILFSKKSFFLSLIIICLVTFFSPFVSAEGTVTVSVPDSPGFMGHKVFLPINIDNAQDVAGFQLTIKYDPNLLTKPEVFKGDLINGDANWRIQTNVTSGLVTILGYHALSEVFSQIDGNLIKLNFTVADNVPMGTEINLHINECTISDPEGQSIPNITEDGVITVLKGRKGDVNTDDTVNILDVVRIVNFALMKADPTDIEKYTADVNDDADINIVDVVQTVNIALGRVVEEPLPQGLVYEDCLISRVKWDLDHFVIMLEPTQPNETNAGWYDLAPNCKLKGADTVPGLVNTIADIIYDEENEVIVNIEVTSKSLIQSGDKWGYLADENRYIINGIKYNIADFIQGTLIDNFDDTLWYKAFFTQDGEIWKVAIRSTQTPGIVDEYNPLTKRLTLKCAGDFMASYDFMNQDVFVERDGQNAQLSDIAENDTVYIWESMYGFDYYIQASSHKESGTFEALYEGGYPYQVKINGVKYAVAANSRMSRDGGVEFDSSIDGSALDDVFGNQVQFILNKSNQIVYLISDADLETDVEYGVVTEIVSKNNITNQINQIKVLKESGEEVSLEIDTEEVELHYLSNVGSNENELDVDDFIKFSLNEQSQIEQITILVYWNSNTSALLDPNYGGTYNVKANYASYDNTPFIGTIVSGDPEYNRIKFSGNWYNVTDNTIIFNSYFDESLGVDDMEATIQNKDSFLEWAEDLYYGGINAYVQFDDGEVKYIYLHDEIPLQSEYGIVMETYIRDGDRWVDVNSFGITNSYELKNAVSPIEDSLIEYTVVNNKLDEGTLIFDPTMFSNNAVFDSTPGSAGSVSACVYARVTDIDSTGRAIEINDIWYYANEDTAIYDYSDWFATSADPRFSDNIADIKVNDYIIYMDNGDGNHVAEMLIKVNNIAEMPGGEIPPDDDVQDIPGTLYGAVTEIRNINSINRTITEIKVLGQDGNESNYFIDSDDVELFYRGSTGDNFNDLDVDDFIKFTVNDSNIIDSITILAYWDSNMNPPVIVDPFNFGSPNVKFYYVNNDNSKYLGQITDGDTASGRIRFNGNWYSVTDETVVFNAYLDEAQGDDNEASLTSGRDLVDWAEELVGPEAAYVQYEGSAVKYVFHHSAVASDVDYGVVNDMYMLDGDIWVDVDNRGEQNSFEVKATRPVFSGLYEYTVSGNKIDCGVLIFDPNEFSRDAVFNGMPGNCGSIEGKVYAQVTDVNTSFRAVKINGVWYFADDDTIIYDYSDWYDAGDDPVFSNVADINEGDYIVFVDNGEGNNVAEMFLIVNNIN